jgi:hypothetical protein
VSGPVLRSVLDRRTLAVAIDPGKVEHRVWLATGDGGLVGDERDQLGDVVAVAGGERGGERCAVAAGDQVVLGA